MGLLLFVCVVGVGVLGALAIVSVARKQLVIHRRERAKLEAQRARAAEVARLAAERAALLPPLPDAAVPEPLVDSLSGVIAKLEHSVPFRRLSSPVIE